MGAKLKKKIDFAKCKGWHLAKRASRQFSRVLSSPSATCLPLGEASSSLSARRRHLAKPTARDGDGCRQASPSAFLRRVLGTWRRGHFAKCVSSPSAWHLAKPSSPSAGFAKSQALGEAFFTKCPIFGTRRTLGHLAKPGFHVVNGTGREKTPNA